MRIIGNRKYLKNNWYSVSKLEISITKFQNFEYFHWVFFDYLHSRSTSTNTIIVKAKRFVLKNIFALSQHTRALANTLHNIFIAISLDYKTKALVVQALKPALLEPRSKKRPLYRLSYKRLIKKQR